MSYKALPLNLPWDGGVSHAHDNPDDGVSPLSSTASQPGYKAYRPPSGPSYQPTITYTTSARLPTPPTHNPISWPGIFPSRTPSQTQSRSPVPSLGVRPQLTQPYEESLPWANQSTHFRTASTGSAAADYTSLYDDSSRPASKQYFRNPRHERAAWGSTGLFPWKGVGAMISVGLCSSTALIYATHTTPTSSWHPFTPATYLSLLDLFTTTLMLCAFAEGCVITFWWRLLHGTTIADVYDTYEYASLWPALCSLLRLQYHPIALASLFTAISLLRGPFFQRALLVHGDRYVLSTPYLAIAISLSLTPLLVIVPLYRGYSSLGRRVSLHPLEIARAFAAPLFEGLDGNVPARDIGIEKGATKVRYGAVEKNGEEKVLRVEDVGRTNVRTPRRGEIFG
ncbi:hypothetical protein IQ06DRAFT_360631 [Phaeosphaeriaceae sp. SRC1lsM3a]|nr:hypothetical protein IQ06DRAFT_360631 [Stagonospora sp. SRC1lsM3a]